MYHWLKLTVLLLLAGFTSSAWAVQFVDFKYGEGYLGTPNSRTWIFDLDNDVLLQGDINAEDTIDVANLRLELMDDALSQTDLFSEDAELSLNGSTIPLEDPTLPFEINVLAHLIGHQLTVILTAIQGDFHVESVILRGDYTDNQQPPDQQPVPEPATLALLGLGLSGWGLMRRLRRG